MSKAAREEGAVDLSTATDDFLPITSEDEEVGQIQEEEPVDGTPLEGARPSDASIEDVSANPLLAKRDKSVKRDGPFEDASGDDALAEDDAPIEEDASGDDAYIEDDASIEDSPVNYDDEGLGEVEIEGMLYRFDSGKQGTALCLSRRVEGSWRWEFLGEMRWDGRDLRSKVVERQLLTLLSLELRKISAMDEAD